MLRVLAAAAALALIALACGGTDAPDPATAEPIADTVAAATATEAPTATPSPTESPEPIFEGEREVTEYERMIQAMQQRINAASLEPARAFSEASQCAISEECSDEDLVLAYDNLARQAQAYLSMIDPEIQALQDALPSEGWDEFHKIYLQLLVTRREAFFLLGTGWESGDIGKMTEGEVKLFEAAGLSDDLASAIPGSEKVNTNILTITLEIIGILGEFNASISLLQTEASLCDSPDECTDINARLSEEIFDHIALIRQKIDDILAKEIEVIGTDYEPVFRIALGVLTLQEKGWELIHTGIQTNSPSLIQQGNDYLAESSSLGVTMSDELASFTNR